MDERQRRRLIAGVAVAVAAILVLGFILENTDRVSVSFVFFTTRVSLIWVILGCLLAGAALGVAGAALVRRRRLSRPRPEAQETTRHTPRRGR